MALLLDITSNPQEWTDGNWPRAHMNGDAGNGIYEWSFTWSAASMSDWGAFFARPNGGIWMTSEENFEIYDTSDNLMISRAVTWTTSSTTTQRVNAATGSLTLSGYASGNGTFSFTPADIFTTGTLKAGGISGQSGWVIPGTFSDLDDTEVADVEGVVNATLAAATVSAAGVVDVNGVVNATLDAATVSAAGVVDVNGVVNATLGDATVASDGTVGGGEAGGEVNVTLDDVTVSAAGTVDVNGVVNATLDAATVSAAGTVDVNGVVNATLGALSLNSAGSVEVSGQLATTLGDATLVAGDGGTGDFEPGVSSSSISTFGHAEDTQSAPGGYLPPGGGGADMDGRVPTAVETQTSGSSFFAYVGRPVSATEGLTDNKGNTWTELNESNYGTFRPEWNAWEAAHLTCVDGTGGTNHVVTHDSVVGDEMTIMWSEVKGAHHIADWSMVARTQGSQQISAPIDTTGPAWVYVDWMGDGGPDGAEGSSWTVTAVDEGSTVGTHWQVIDSRIVNHTDGWFQIKRWARYFPNATSGIQMEIDTVSPDQGAFFFAIAFQEADWLSGTVNATLGNATVSAEGAVDVNGVVASTLDNATVATAGSVDVNGEVNATLGDATIASTGVVDVTGALSSNLGDATLSAEGSVEVTGVVAATLEDASVSAVATADNPIVVDVTLDDAGVSAAGSVEVVGSVDSTLGNATLSAAGSVEVIGALSTTLSDALVTATAVNNDGSVDECCGVGEVVTAYDAQQVLKCRFVRQWVDGALNPLTPIIMSNEATPEPTIGPWVRFSFQIFESKQETVGAAPDRSFRRRGMLHIEVNVDQNQGEGAAWVLAQTAADIYEAMAVCGVTCYEATPRLVGPVGRWFRVVTEVLFYYHNTK